MKKLTCSYYMENNKAFTLINSGQTSSFFIVTIGSYQPITSTEKAKGTSL